MIIYKNRFKVVIFDFEEKESYSKYFEDEEKYKEAVEKMKEVFEDL